MKQYNDNTIIENKWYKNGKLHRDNDLPAVTQSITTIVTQYENEEDHYDVYADYYGESYDDYDSCEKWYKNGNLHRDNDMPAVIYADGSKEWYKNGKLYKKVIDQEFPDIS